MSVRILEGDCRDVLRDLPADSVQMTVTSPPYWGLRNYDIPPSLWGGEADCPHEWGDEIAVNATNHTTKARWNHTRKGRDELQPPEKRVSWLRTEVKQGQFCQHCGAWAGAFGLEPTYQLYVDHAVEVFREVRRVLRPDGVLWLNLGDSYCSGGRATWRSGASENKGQDVLNDMPRPAQPADLKPKDLIGIPWRVAFALQADGWWLRQDIIWCLSGGTRVYARTQKGDMPTTIKDLVRLDPATVQLWNGERWTQVFGWSETPRPDKTYEIELRSGERIGCTAGHEWPIQRGNKRADELRIGDIIQRCRLPEPDLPRHPEALDDAEIGWLVGTFLADGSWSHDRAAFTIASNVNETERFERLRRIAERWDASYRIAWTEGNGSRPIVHSRILAAVIQTYLSGENAKGKHLDVRCWRRTNTFLHHLLLGYLQGDGHYDEPNRRWRIGFTQNDALAADLRTICARLGFQLRLKRYDHQSQWGVFPGWKGEIRFEPSTHHNTRDDGEIIAIRESRARKFWDIGVANEPHLFALASGILTHNSKPNPMPESVTDRCTKSHEYLFLLSKSERYYYDAEAIKEESITNDPRRPYTSEGAWQLDGRPIEQRHGGKPRKTKVPGGWDTGAGAHGTIHREGRTEAQYVETAAITSRNRRSVWTIATAPFAEAHFACVDADTEALTPDGWRDHEDLQDGDLIAAYDQQSGILSWQPATFHRYPFDGELVAIEKRDASQRLTPNHRCLVKRQIGGEAVVEARELKPSMQIPTTGLLHVDEVAGPGADFAALLGWYLTEGEKRRHQIIRINQSWSANREKVEAIRALLGRLRADYTEALRCREWRGRPSEMVVFSVRGEIAERLHNYSPAKAISLAWVAWPRADIEALLDAIIDGDGHRRADGRRCIVQKDRGFIDAVQILALRLGKNVAASQRKDGNFVAYLTDGAWLTLRSTDGRHIPFGTVEYEGIVWCPSVLGSFWLARRRGRTFITGNTFPPALVEPCILAGTSAKGVCPNCGAPWVRQTERVDRGYDGSRYGESAVAATGGAISGGTARSTLGSSNGKLTGKNATTGWAPSCACPTAEPVPATVLDCFAGAGTSLMVADRLGRNAIGIELSPVYANMARRRCEEDAGMFAQVAAQ